MSNYSFNINSTRLRLQISSQLCKMTPWNHVFISLFSLIQTVFGLTAPDRQTDGELIWMRRGGIPPRQTRSLWSSSSWKKTLHRADRIPAIPLYSNPSSIRPTRSSGFHLSLHVSLSLSLSLVFSLHTSFFSFISVFTALCSKVNSRNVQVCTLKNVVY